MRCNICQGAIAPWLQHRIQGEVEAAGLTVAEVVIVHKRCYLVHREPYTAHATWAPREPVS